MKLDNDVAGAGIPQFGRIFFSPDQNGGGTEIDALLDAGSDPNAGNPPDPAAGGDGAPGGGDGGTGGGNADNSGGAEVDLGPKFGKVKVSDLQAALGRQKQYSQSTAKIKKYEALLAKLDSDPSLQEDIMEALASRDEDSSTSRGRRTPPEDDEEEGTGRPDQALLHKNPVEYIRQLDRYYEAQLFEQKERIAGQVIDREERELKTEYKLDDNAIREIQKVCLKYRDAKGDPLPMKQGFAIWNNPKLMQEQAKLKDQVNARSSGIPGGRSSGILSRKKVSEMSETEKEQAMLDAYYEAEAKSSGSR